MSLLLEEIKTDDDFIIDMMYSGTENMLMTDVYGKVGLGNRCFVHPDVKTSLEQVRKELRKRNLKLKICDGYRPPQAHEMMLKIIPMVGFFARSPDLSQHCQGSAIDVILCNKEGKELDFPCRVDGYEKRFAEQISQGEWEEFKIHLEKGKYVWNEERKSPKTANRDLQRKIMEQAGLKALEHEWWHFNLPNKEKYRTIWFKNSGCQKIEFIEKI